ncbi:MAG TPA: hypothetical protein VG944_03260, partial [Fimbriimonas sp.]|nr:hypothetical protein [Fimbriimonas sp.]
MTDKPTRYAGWKENRTGTKPYSRWADPVFRPRAMTRGVSSMAALLIVDLGGHVSLWMALAVVLFATPFLLLLLRRVRIVAN